MSEASGAVPSTDRGVESWSDRRIGYCAPKACATSRLADGSDAPKREPHAVVPLTLHLDRCSGQPHRSAPSRANCPTHRSHRGPAGQHSEARGAVRSGAISRVHERDARCRSRACVSTRVPGSSCRCERPRSDELDDQLRDDPRAPPLGQHLPPGERIARRSWRSRRDTVHPRRPRSDRIGPSLDQRRGHAAPPSTRPIRTRHTSGPCST